MIKGNERESLNDESMAYPGDIIGIPNQQGLLSIGDTLYTGGNRISYAKSEGHARPQTTALFEHAPQRQRAIDYPAHGLVVSIHEHRLCNVDCPYT